MKFALKNLNNLSNKVNFVSIFSKAHNIDIFAITESWLQPHIVNAAVDIMDYILYRNDFPSPHPKFGVCVYVKKNLRAEMYHGIAAHPNTLLVHIPNLRLFVLIVYRPPSYSREENVALINYVQDICIGREVIYTFTARLKIAIFT